MRAEGIGISEDRNKRGRRDEIKKYADLVSEKMLIKFTSDHQKEQLTHLIAQ